MAIGDPLVTLKISSAACSSIAALSTLFRLWRRRNRLWADDGCAAFALVFLCIQVVVVFLRPLPQSLPQTSRVAGYYLMAFTFYAVVWLSRLSILFSIIRIHPSPSRQRHLLYIAGTFLVAMLFFMSQVLWACEPLRGWKDESNPHCPLPRSVPICQLVTDVIADAILMYFPLHLFRDLLDKSLHLKLGVIFSTCVVTTVVSLVHVVYIMTHDEIKEDISGIIEGCISLIVTNIPVVVSALFPLSRDQDPVPSHSLIFRISSMRTGEVDSSRTNERYTKPEAANLSLDIEGTAPSKFSEVSRPNALVVFDRNALSRC